MEPCGIPVSNLPLPREQGSRKGLSKVASCKGLGLLSCLPSQRLTIPPQREAKENIAFPDAHSFHASLVPRKESFQMKQRLCFSPKFPVLRLNIGSMFKKDLEDKVQEYFFGIRSTV